MPAVVRERWIAVLTVAVALAVWPGAERTFSSPKLVLLAAGAAVALLLALVEPRPASRAARLLGFGWLASLGLSSIGGGFVEPSRMALEAAAALLLVALLQRTPRADVVLEGLAWAGSAVAAIAALQLASVDPFAWLGLAPEGATARMRVYATLGNPDFVAALLGVTVVVAALRWSGWRRALVALQLVALIGCASWATLLALAGAAVAWVLSRGAPSWRAAIAASALALAAVLVLAVTREPGPGRALEGRLYLARVAAPHAADAPLAGGGPGSVQVRWPAWEAQRWANGLAPESERRFAALQDHVHDDYLEWLLELGLLGLAVRVALVAAALAAALRSGTREGAIVAAGLASLLARALVDFPLARPTELCVLIVLIASAFAAAQARRSS